MWSFKRRPAQVRTGKVGNFLFRIFGLATVEGAIQGWSPEARDQYKRMRANHKRQAQARAQQTQTQAQTQARTGADAPTSHAA